MNDFTVTIVAEQTSGTGTFTLTPTDDGIAEGNETVSVTGSVTGLTVTDTELTITDNDMASTGVTLSVSPDEVGESASATTITVSAMLNGGAFTQDTTVSVSVGKTGDSATSGTDYTSVSDFTVTIAVAQTSGTGTFTLTPVSDDLDEDNETVSVGGAVTGLTVTAAEVTITDDDTRGVTVDPTSLTVAEGGDDTYTVVLKSKPTADVTVTVSVPENTDVSVDTDSNEEGNQNTLTFTADNWSTEQTVTVSAAEDADAVVDDAVTVGHTANGGDYVNESANVEVTITENDTPTLSIADGSAAENAGSVTFTVSLSVASSNAVTVTWETSDGTAEVGKDYTAVTNGSITFSPGDLTQAITVTIADDDVDEVNETFTVTLSNAVNATLDGGESTLEATGTITDDDERGVTVSPTSLTVAEGGTGTYTVALTSEPTADVTVTVSVPTEYGCIGGYGLKRGRQPEYLDVHGG